MPTKGKLGPLQKAIVDHVKGLEAGTRATTQDLVRAIQQATGRKKVAQTSLFGAIRSLRSQGLIVVERAGRELRVGAGDTKVAARKAASTARGAAQRVAGKARAVATAATQDPLVGKVLAPGESVIVHVEKDVVHVLENVHGRVEHRKVSRKG